MPQAFRSFWTSTACALVASCLFSAALRGADQPAASARPAAQMETYAANGEAYFALEVMPQVAEPQRQPHDIAVLFDTSASQTGSFRKKGLAALHQLLANLDAVDRVALLAVDVNAIGLTTGLQKADSADMGRALGELQRRVPLGSTDMDGAITTAVKQLMSAAKPGRARSIVYIGDGMSTAHLLFSDRLRQLADQLVESRISVNSYGLGPRTDMQLLGALAKHSGGMLLVDRDDRTGAQLGGLMADAARGTVIWPMSVELPAGFDQTYFRGVAPLRFDRETVLLGHAEAALVAETKKIDLKVQAEAAGKPLTLRWSLNVARPLDENAYLSEVIKTASRDGGLSLPTIGAAGLADLRWFVNAQADNLAQLGQQAFALGQLDEAKQLAAQAARLDPLNPRADVLRSALEKGKPTGSAKGAAVAPLKAGPQPLRLASQASAAPAPVGPAPDDAEEEAEGDLLNEVEEQQRVYVQFLRTQVQNTVNEASKMTGYDPENAINMLKLTLETVNQAPELDPAVRSQLRDKIEAALQIASRQALIKSENDLRRAQIEAEGQARERINQELFLQEQKVDQLMARFNALMDEERYRDAEAVANIAEAMSPNTPGLRTAELTARMVGYTADIMAVVDARHKGVIDSLFQTELSHIPTPDEPPILYPDPETWQLLTERRKKYKAVDLTQSNPNEAKIIAALDDKTELEFVDQPLTDVVEYLKERHEIEIQLDNRALSDEGVGSDTPVTRNIKGISLRSALRLMLGELDLTYVIRNEVLMITTKTEAENMLTNKVYPVADLVIPVRPPRMGGMGGMGGMGMGGMRGMGMGF